MINQSFKGYRCESDNQLQKRRISRFKLTQIALEPVDQVVESSDPVGESHPEEAPGSSQTLLKLTLLQLLVTKGKHGLYKRDC